MKTPATRRARAAPLIPFRLLFEHDARPYVWTGHAADATAAEVQARAELFGGNPFATGAGPRLMQLVQGSF
jgi:hypothetical protein